MKEKGDEGTGVRPVPVEAPAPEALRRAADLKTEIAVLKRQAAEVAEKLNRADSQHEELRSRLASESEASEQKRKALTEQERRLARLRETIELRRRRQRLLQDQLEEAERAEAPVKTIQHKLTPVSHRVDDEEMHFRIAEGRVAFVPVDELIERLRTRVLRQKDWLVKFRRHQGEIGPVGGFTMYYTVERQRLSVIEELRNGSGTMRIGVSEWQIKPEPTLRTESVEEALRPGSAFLRAVYQAKPQTTLTFWVYPDSFAAFRRLQKFAHQEGFVVAARPLPFGVPIAGSPRGTRSAGQ